MSRKTAEDRFTHAAVAIATHHQQVCLDFFGGGEQNFDSSTIVPLQSSRPDIWVMPCQGISEMVAGLLADLCPLLD